MKIWSWNVNGLRACAKKGFVDVLGQSGADIVGLQEVRALESQLPDDVKTPAGWHTAFSPAERKGYSGVGLYSRAAPDSLTTSIDEARFDVEGRVQIAEYGDLKLANVYFPNGSGKNRDNSRIPYKLDFYARLFELLKPDFDAGRPVLVMGDFNTAHAEIDLARPKSNKKTSGFRPEERAALDQLLALGWVDTFRAAHPELEGAYSWWSNRPGIRARNVGWRIDYVYASPAAAARITDAFILPDVMGSDHCPVGVDIDL